MRLNTLTINVFFGGGGQNVALAKVCALLSARSSFFSISLLLSICPGEVNSCRKFSVRLTWLCLDGLRVLEEQLKPESYPGSSWWLHLYSCGFHSFSGKDYDEEFDVTRSRHKSSMRKHIISPNISDVRLGVAHFTQWTSHVSVIVLMHKMNIVQDIK